MDNRDIEVRPEDEYKNKRRGGWLIPVVLLLLLLLLLGFFLLRDTDSTNNNDATQNTNSATSQNNDSNDQASLRQRFDRQFDATARTILFTPDTTNYEDAAAAETKINTLAAFIKDNPSAKITVNGSIFDDQQIDSASNLAKQRAELVKDALAQKGAPTNNISISTVDNYEGQDEAARAQYARSVVVSVQ